MTVLGVILAGGQSRRMGTDKALVQIAGIPMVLRVAAALAGVADEVIVVGRSGELLGLPCVPDDGPPHRGPLAGIAVALHLAGNGLLAVAGVDQPWLLSATTLRLMARADEASASVPVDRDVPQVTCAVYPATWAAEARAALERGGAAQDLLTRLPWRPAPEQEWRSWGEDGRSWFSVDSLEALENGLARYGPP